MHTTHLEFYSAIGPNGDNSLDWIKKAVKIWIKKAVKIKSLPPSIRHTGCPRQKATGYSFDVTLRKGSATLPTAFNPLGRGNRFHRKQIRPSQRRTSS